MTKKRGTKKAAKANSARKVDGLSASPVCKKGQRDSQNLNTTKTLAVGADVRVSRLDTLAACRAELGRLYRESRRRAGRFPAPLEAKRLAGVLGEVRSAIELEDLEVRLAALEKLVETRAR